MILDQVELEIFQLVDATSAPFAHIGYSVNGFLICDPTRTQCLARMTRGGPLVYSPLPNKGQEEKSVGFNA